MLADLNRQHLAAHPLEADLEARIASYELAARMQSAAKEALDISGESEATKKLYGLDDPTTAEYGTRCLIARRLVERGVRFVQLFLGGQPWDNHTDIRSTLPAICRRTDKPSAGLVKDLKARGLLDTTLVHWGGEIGRLPVTEGDGEKCGRDHNGQGFSTWLAGGGIKGGITYGQTDEFGHRAAVDTVGPNDYQATLLHLFGTRSQPARLPLQRPGAEADRQPAVPRGEGTVGVRVRFPLPNVGEGGESTQRVRGRGASGFHYPSPAWAMAQAVPLPQGARVTRSGTCTEVPIDVHAQSRPRHRSW